MRAVKMSHKRVERLLGGSVENRRDAKYFFWNANCMCQEDTLLCKVDDCVM